MDLRKAELDRALALSKGGVSSQADLDEKRAAYGVATATWEKAKAVRDYAVVRAPFAGVVTEKFARLGEKVHRYPERTAFQGHRFRASARAVLRPGEGVTLVSKGRCGRGRSRELPTGSHDRYDRVHQPDGGRGEWNFPSLGPRTTRHGADL